jgi:hypothetical protein
LRQRRKARRCCLGVRGSVRLSVVQPLALGPTQQRVGAVCVVNAKRGTVIVFEIGFRKVAVQMGFVDMVELPIYGALQYREE